jgi:hypothetical protein
MRVRIKLKGRIRIRKYMKYEPIFEHFFKVWAFIWKLGSGFGSASKWKVRSGSASKWQASSGSWSASKWQPGSASGSASKRCGSATLLTWERKHWPPSLKAYRTMLWSPPFPVANKDIISYQKVWLPGRREKVWLSGRWEKVWLSGRWEKVSQFSLWENKTIAFPTSQFFSVGASGTIPAVI